MTAAGDDISKETRMRAAQVRARAAGMPGAADLGDMAADALAGGTAMDPDEIRALAREALTQAQRVSYLLGRLAGLLDYEDTS